MKGRPKITGMGETYEKAEDDLINSIIHRSKNLAADVPYTLEFIPPLPPAAEAEKYLQPELYLIDGNNQADIVELQNSITTGYDGYFDQPYCRSCHR